MRRATDCRIPQAPCDYTCGFADCDTQLHKPRNDSRKINRNWPHFITAASLYLFLAAVEVSGLSAAQANTQNGFTIALEHVTASPAGICLHVTLANHGSETIYLYESNTEIWQGNKKHEPKRMWGNASAVPAKYPPGSDVNGHILFPSLIPGDTDVLVRFQSPANTNNSVPWEPVEFLLSLPFPEESPEAFPVGSLQSTVPRIAIIRADDMTEPSLGWHRFLSSSRKLGVKVAIGIICDSLRNDRNGYHTWLRELQQTGEVEFWIHGWDHKKLQSDGLRTVSEFRESGYDYQKQHLADSQAFMLNVLGTSAAALGTPWNDFDRDTIRVVNEDPDLHLLFAHQTDLFDNDTAVMRILPIPTNGGTGKPDFAKFKAFYDANQRSLGAVAFQFHPRNYSAHHQAEYERIIAYLIQEGWIFMQPQEYLAWLKTHSSP